MKRIEFMAIYTIIESKLVDEDGNDYISYGICAECESEILKIEDISLIKNEVLKIIDIAVKYELSALHLMDYVFDCIGM